MLQVLVITHNPIIAAIADEHYVVRRISESKSTTPDTNERNNIKSSTILLSSQLPTSQVSLVTGNKREEEISRMATGNLNTDAGLKLAKALLNLDYLDESSL